MYEKVKALKETELKCLRYKCSLTRCVIRRLRLAVFPSLCLLLIGGKYIKKESGGVENSASLTETRFTKDFTL